MQELKCPKCGEVFHVDEQGYAQLVSQIRNKEFEKELKRREEELIARKTVKCKLCDCKRKRNRKNFLLKQRLSC